MAVKVLYGVGNTILREFTNEANIVALSKLKNVSIDITASEEKLTGGDSPYPIASFPKDKAIKISAENATFDMKMLNVTQGASVTTGAVTFDEVKEFIVPDDGVVNLDFTPIADSLVVDGFTEATDIGTVATGKYFQDGVDPKKLNFATADAGKEVTLVYQRTSAVGTETMAVYKETLAKPFKFIHRIDIYDDNNTVVGKAQLTVFKAKATNSFNFNLQPQQAFAPKLELEALDPKRPDGKMWDFSVEKV